jgi:xanthine dehydrogenase accessory factor
MQFMTENSEIMAEAIAWREKGLDVALATVVSTWGSSPRPIGSRLAVDGAGRFIGSVSGGCVEGAVLETAEDVMQSGLPTLLVFGVSDEKAWSVGLACGGVISIFVEKFSDPDRFKTILNRMDEGQSTTLITSLDTGKRSDPDGRLEAFDLSEESAAALYAAQFSGKEGLVETASGNFFVEVWRPSLRLVIVGAVHIAQPLAAIAGLAGYDVTIIDPRTAFATKERFASVTLMTEWPDHALKKLNLNERSAVVALTHDPKIDDPALTTALRSPVFYIGALGSRKTAEKRRERFRALGFAEEALSRIRGPAGINIGAVTPAEIAISILAEMTATLRKERVAAKVSAVNEV